MANSNRPNLTLKMDDKIYLAVVKKDLDKLAFVYTLACLKAAKQSNMYNMVATPEIHTFKNKESAQVYYETIDEIVNVNANDETKQQFFSVNEKIIERFMENIR